MKGWTQADIDRITNKAEVAVKKSVSKYRNQKTDGFDSKKEAKYYQDLKVREQIGEVTAIQCQVSFNLTDCKYIADFVYYDIKEQEFKVVDVKGVKTDIYRLKKKMFERIFNLKIIEI